MDVEIPSGIASKNDLLEIIGEKLHLPDYYGVNWDAFDECIRDLSWIHARDITIRHFDIPVINEKSSANSYLVIIYDAMNKFAKGRDHRLKIIFPPELKTEVLSLLCEKKLEIEMVNKSFFKNE
jgi:hypothetical protein